MTEFWLVIVRMPTFIPSVLPIVLTVVMITIIIIVCHITILETVLWTSTLFALSTRRRAIVIYPLGVILKVIHFIIVKYY